MNLFFRYALIIMFISSLTFVCGCSETNLNSSSNEYLVLMVEHNDEGTIISGAVPPEHVYQMPEPFYYNKDLVHSQYGYSVDHAPGYPEINESLKVLFGVYYNELRQGNQSGHLIVSGIYSYPYGLENGPTILDVTENGTVLLSYDNSSIDLKINDTWRSPVISTRSETYNETYTTTDNNGKNSTRNYQYTVKWDTTWTIHSMGAYKK